MRSKFRPQPQRTPQKNTRLDPLANGFGRSTKFIWRLFVPLTLVLLVVTNSLAEDDVAGGPDPSTAHREGVSSIQFNRDIRPILSNYCFACHGPDEGQRQADLRFDVETSAKADLGGYQPLAAGKPEQSEAYLRMLSDDPDYRMPPAELGKMPSAEQIELVRRWIEQGAAWEDHWSFSRLTRPTVPETPADWNPTNAIDRFVHQRLRETAFSPAQPADRRTLVRRLYFDLLGLPPSAEVVRRFERDASPTAYEELVDDVLASKHFGERMAVFWLDLVRYADSIGYHSDNPRDVWMYRDYVIDSFNTNKPFDQFTIEQLAGDLYASPTDETRIASGYNRLLQTTEEGGAQPKEYLAKYAADRVRNVASVWMAATMGCAECHDHKYDPFTTRDFYSLGAFFADIEEPAVGRQVPTRFPTEEAQQQLAAIDERLAQLERQLTESSAEIQAAQAQWETSIRQQLDREQQLESKRTEDQAWIYGKHVPAGQQQGDWVYTGRNEGPWHLEQPSRLQQADELVQHLVINTPPERLASGDSLYVHVYLDPNQAPEQIMVQVFAGDWSHRIWWGADKIPYGAETGLDSPAHFQAGPLPDTGKWVRISLDPSSLGLDETSEIRGIAFTQWGGRAYWGAAGFCRDSLGQLRGNGLLEIITTAPDQRDREASDKLAAYFRNNTEHLEPVRLEVSELKAQREKIETSQPQTLVTVTKKPATMRVLPRGNWLDDSGPVVQPEVPTFLDSIASEGRRANRMDLAQWLVSPDHPLTARAMTNRLWKLCFGYGIARTLDDLGAQGEWPTHPQLLDWLAVELIESDWDVKHVIRLMVTSSTYRQSSHATASLRAADPYNKLFARQSRFRLEAEFVRDNALAVSGLLSRKIGGPSVKPYQPSGYWQHLNFPVRTWQPTPGENLYRRGLYTHWQRTFLHPSLLAFDAQSREECVASRPRSNTPQQALVLLNDPTYVEAARVSAERLLAPPLATNAERITTLYETILQRPPSAQETDLLLQLLEKHAAQFASDPDAARKLVGVGAAQLRGDTDVANLAAWTNVVRAVLNMHETITRY